jgi:O-antigen ligase
LLTLLLALVVWVHIVATTSIKTNLGIIIALFVVAVLNVRGSVKLLLRGAIPLAILIGGITYAVLSNPTLIAGIERGATRVSAGASLLLAREDDASNTSVGLSVRENWKNLGIRGWAENPVFGHGAEAFRADFGITSHSTPIDLLYNTGLIGIGLFYGIFAAMLWRWYHDRDPRRRGLRAIMLGITCCYLFISASGLVYYDAFLPAFVGIAAGLHKRRTEEVLEVPALELPAPT